MVRALLTRRSFGADPGSIVCDLTVLDPGAAVAIQPFACRGPIHRNHRLGAHLHQAGLDQILHGAASLELTSAAPIDDATDGGSAADADEEAPLVRPDTHLVALYLWRQRDQRVEGRDDGFDRPPLRKTGQGLGQDRLDGHRGTRPRRLAIAVEGERALLQAHEFEAGINGCLGPPDIGTDEVPGFEPDPSVQAVADHPQFPGLLRG